LRTPKVMKLIDPYTGLMECKVCGSRHLANLKSGGNYIRGSWQCMNGCRLEDLEKPGPLKGEGEPVLKET
jgi:hypothetical protein